jgi:hypothetical protein
VSGECNCGHGPHVHVRFIGGCGLCECVYFVRANLDLSPWITITTHTGPQAYATEADR